LVSNNAAATQESNMNITSIIAIVFTILITAGATANAERAYSPAKTFDGGYASAGEAARHSQRPPHARIPPQAYGHQFDYDVSEPNFGQGSRCVTDEGYGRWSYCESN
jgi:hypothetical protein